MWDGFVQDLRYTGRTLRREPGFAVFAVLILALGIGANTAVFSIAEPLVFRALPFRDPERLVWIANKGKSEGLSAVTSRSSNLRDWRRLNQSFEDLAGYFAFFDYGGFTLTGVGEPERLVGVGITQTFLSTLGVQPMLGRDFVTEECVWNGRPAVILTYGFWQRRFGSDRAIVGRSITLNDVPTTIVGVLPPTFDFASIFSPGSRVDFLNPFPVADETDRWGNTLSIVGRLKPGVTIQTAAREIDLINEQLQRADPGRWGLGAVLTPMQEKITGRFRRTVVVLICAVCFVLLIACTNLSNLLLARASARRREIAVRSAIGATRLRLVRQMLTESFVLSVCGAAVGILIAIAVTRMVASTRALSIPMLQSVRLDQLALGFTVIVALVTGLLFGIVPALQVSGQDHEALKEASRGSTEGRRGAWIRSSLMVSEVALACMLVVGAGLLLRSFVTLLQVDLGFQPDHTASWRIATGGRFNDVSERRIFHDRLVQAVQAIPGVDSVGLTDTLPLGRNRSWGAGVKGRTFERGQGPTAFPRMVDSGYIRTMKIPLLAGRDFTKDDTADKDKVIIINQTMAQKLWPGGNALGQIFLISRAEWHVIGVVANVRHGSLEKEAESEMYMLITQQTDWGSLDLVVRTKLAPDAIAPSVRATLRSFDQHLPLSDFQTLGDIVDRAVSPRRFLVQVLGAFAIAALVLASLGIYGVVSYSVGQRLQEFGIRMALGASPADVLLRVVSRMLALTLGGIAIGLVGSLLLSGAIRSLLSGVTSTDPVTFSVMALVLTLVALLASYIPARRAIRVELATVLRNG
jgi:predicted permease